MKTTLFDYICITVLSMFGLFWLLALLVLVPVMAVTESECLAKGYPKYAVDYKLNRYCLNLQGTVTVKVEELK